MRPVLSFSLAASIHWFAQSYCDLTNATNITMLRLLLLYQFWRAKICICHKPYPTRDETCDLQIALPTMLMLPFFFYTSSTPHTRHSRTGFELWGRPFCSSLLASSFLLVLLWKEFNPHSFIVTFHFPCLFIQLTTCFLSSRGQLLDSWKRQLFCRHIQHATRLFEWQAPVGSLEAAVCGFCLSISLQ